MRDLDVKVGDAVICIKRKVSTWPEYNFNIGDIKFVEKALITDNIVVNSTYVNIDGAGNKSNPSLAKFYFIKLTKLGKLLYCENKC